MIDFKTFNNLGSFGGYPPKLLLFGLCKTCFEDILALPVIPITSHLPRHHVLKYFWDMRSARTAPYSLGSQNP